MGLSSAATEAETRWLATLAEVRRQAARVAEAAGVQARTHSKARPVRYPCMRYTAQALLQRCWQAAPGRQPRRSVAGRPGQKYQCRTKSSFWPAGARRRRHVVRRVRGPQHHSGAGGVCGLVGGLALPAVAQCVLRAGAGLARAARFSSNAFVSRTVSWRLTFRLHDSLLRRALKCNFAVGVSF